MKNLKYFFSALALVALTLVSCDPVVPPVDPPVDPPVEKEEAPAIAAPAAGKVIVAVRVPEGTCNGIVAIGAGSPDFATDWKLTSVVPFVKVSGTETWYSVTLTYAADMAVKVIAVPQAGQSSLDWGTQWGMNKEGEEPNVLLMGETTATLDNSENGGEVKMLNCPDGGVVYVDIVAWKSAPCVAKNAAGTATFKVTVPATTPANASVSVAGSWGANGDPEFWTPGAVVMTNNNDGTYSLTKDVPASFQYKYVVSADGTTWAWANQFETQFEMPVSLNAVDVVSAWAADPFQ